MLIGNQTVNALKWIKKTSKSNANTAHDRKKCNISKILNILGLSERKQWKGSVIGLTNVK